MKFFETAPKESPEMRQAKENLAGAESALRESIFRLGQTYYMAHKDDAAGDYADQVEMVRRQEENRRGFYQNVLRLEGKMMCENCGTIIPFGSGGPARPTGASPPCLRAGRTCERRRQSKRRGDKARRRQSRPEWYARIAEPC